MSEYHDAFWALENVLHQYGAELLDAPERLLGMINDLAYRREYAEQRNLILHALDKDIVECIRNAYYDFTSREEQLSTAIGMLQNRYGISSLQAWTVISSFLRGLGIECPSATKMGVVEYGKGPVNSFDNTDNTSPPKRTIFLNRFAVSVGAVVALAVIVAVIIHFFKTNAEIGTDDQHFSVNLASSTIHNQNETTTSTTVSSDCSIEPKDIVLSHEELVYSSPITGARITLCWRREFSANFCRE